MAETPLEPPIGAAIPWDEFRRGIAEFNQGQFYTCHDLLEAVWSEALTMDKNFFQGILQIAVALYHLGNHNWRGTVVLLGEGIHRLQPYPPDYYDVNVSKLISDSIELLQTVQTLGADRISQVILSQNRLEPESTTGIVLQCPIIETLY